MLPHGSRTEIINDISSGVDGIVWVVHSLGVGVVSCLANEAILPSKNENSSIENGLPDHCRDQRD